MSTVTRLFSTGTLKIGDIGAASAAITVIGDLQDIELAVTYQEKEMRDAAQNNMFAETRAFYGGKAEIKATVGDFNKALLTRAIGAVTTDQLTFTIGKQSRPGFFKVEIDTVDPDTGIAVTIVAYRFSSPNLTTAFKLDDFVMPSFNGQADPTRETGVNANKVIDYIFSA